LEVPIASQELEDDERLAQLIGPARAMLARVDGLTLSTQRAIASCLFGVVFCLSGAAAAGAAAVIVIAPGHDKGIVVVAAAALVACAGLFGYAIAVMRYDLLPLNTFGQELRGGLRNAEQALFEDSPEFSV
jgi:hypothetical protein